MAQREQFTNIDEKATYAYDTVKLTPDAKKALAQFKIDHDCKTLSDAVLLAVKKEEPHGTASQDKSG
jgi:hypothetical protein